MGTATQTRPNRLGILAMAIAAIALMIGVAHLNLGPVHETKPIEQSIAETAAKIKEAAKRAVTGEPAPSAPAKPDTGINWDTLIQILVYGLAGLAMLVSLVALLRHEQRMPAMMGFSLGAGVLILAWLQWVALVICGAIIIVAILNNLDSILS